MTRAPVPAGRRSPLGRDLFLLLLAAALLVPRPAPSAELTLGVIGDQTGAVSLDRAYEIMAEGVEVLRGRGVEAVIHVGDLVESAFEEDRIRADFARAAGILDRLDRPWRLAAGDHDVNPPLYEPASEDRSRETLFLELLKTRTPEIRDKLYYSFDVGRYAFLALYTQENLHTDPRWGDVFLARLSDAQVRWLKSELEKRRSAEGIVVFLHKPLWYNFAAWRQVHDLLRRHPVAAVIAGHFHYDQDDGEIDGIRYITVGAAGGVIKDAHPDAGGIHHVTVLELSGRQADFTLLPLDHGPARAFTPRLDMDRVQALDQVLDGLAGFGPYNPVYFGPERPLYACEQGRGVLRVNAVGNPLDLPVRVRIEVEQPEPVRGGVRFLWPDCRETEPGRECELGPGAGIELANTSLVKVREDAGPFWEAELASEEAGPVSGQVRIKIRLSFQGQQGPLYIERLITTPTRPCP
ncbi:MAG: metallophosphoesterase [Thermodesulfobacteriota bacterium]